MIGSGYTPARYSDHTSGSDDSGSIYSCCSFRPELLSMEGFKSAENWCLNRSTHSRT
jgi:hypothetical protein